MNPRPVQAAPHRQRGAALLAIILLVVIALITFVVVGLQNEHRPQVRAQEAQQRVGEARDAVIAAAAQAWCADPDAFDTPQGALPCWADGSSDGASIACDRGLDGEGRLPWRSLGTKPIRDADGECLWYQRLGDLAAEPPTEQVIARIFAPGPALEGQIRSGANVGECGNDPDRDNFLEAPGATPNNDLTLEITYGSLAALASACPAGSEEETPEPTGCGAGNPPACSSAAQALAGQANGRNNSCRRLPGNQVSTFCQAQLDIIGSSGCRRECVDAAEKFTTPPCINTLNPPECQDAINALTQP